MVTLTIINLVKMTGIFNINSDEDSEAYNKPEQEALVNLCDIFDDFPKQKPIVPSQNLNTD